MSSLPYFRHRWGTPSWQLLSVFVSSWLLSDLISHWHLLDSRSPTTQASAVSSLPFLRGRPSGINSKLQGTVIVSYFAQSFSLLAYHKAVSASSVGLTPNTSRPSSYPTHPPGLFPLVASTSPSPALLARISHSFPVCPFSCPTVFLHRPSSTITYSTSYIFFFPWRISPFTFPTLLARDYFCFFSFPLLLVTTFIILRVRRKYHLPSYRHVLARHRLLSSTNQQTPYPTPPSPPFEAAASRLQESTRREKGTTPW